MARVSVSGVAMISLLAVIVVQAAYGGIANGGFETGTLSGWTVTSNNVGAGRIVQHPTPPEGTYFAEISSSAFSYYGVTSSDVSLSQTFYARAGDVLTFKYWFSVTGWSDPMDGAQAWTSVSATLDGSLFALEVCNSSMSSNWATVSSNIVTDGYYELKFGTAARANVFGWCPATAAADAYLYVDDVRLTPEPVTVVLLGLGGLVIRRRH